MPALSFLVDTSPKGSVDFYLERSATILLYTKSFITLYILDSSLRYKILSPYTFSGWKY